MFRLLCNRQCTIPSACTLCVHGHAWYHVYAQINQRLVHVYSVWCVEYRDATYPQDGHGDGYGGCESTVSHDDISSAKEMEHSNGMVCGMRTNIELDGDLETLARNEIEAKVLVDDRYMHA